MNKIQNANYHGVTRPQWVTSFGPNKICHFHNKNIPIHVMTMFLQIFRFKFNFEVFLVASLVIGHLRYSLGNDLVPVSNKPLPEPVMTKNYGTIWLLFCFPSHWFLHIFKVLEWRTIHIKWNNIQDYVLIDAECRFQHTEAKATWLTFCRQYFQIPLSWIKVSILSNL